MREDAFLEDAPVAPPPPPLPPPRLGGATRRLPARTTPHLDAGEKLLTPLHFHLPQITQVF